VKPKILLVDDDETILKQMRLALEGDYDVFAAALERDAMSIFLRETPPVVMVDLALNPHSPADLGGMRLLELILSQEPSTRVIVITGNSDHRNALRAVRLGAFDYYAKPIRLDELKVMIRRAIHIHQLQDLVNQDEQVVGNGWHGIVGASKVLKDVFRSIECVASSDVSVLISGESGTGKEIVARAIHLQSQRKNDPFVVVNCGAIPENLIESELFGHERGAFTGAHAQKRGKFELAHSGTLFLDEIGELAPPLQVKLLRFIQDRKIERVGGTVPIEVDVRIIAATNRDLIRDMHNHVFREDLYYRLKVVPIDMPPLRKRKDDIIPLAQFFLAKSCKKHRKPPRTLSAAAEEALLNHPWPGNVRELENLISRTVVLSPRTFINPADLGLTVEKIPRDVNLKLAKRMIEMEFLRKALGRNHGVVSRAARELGISRVNLYELMEKYNLSLQEFKIFKKGKSQIKAREV